jgi:hypothetical protein
LGGVRGADVEGTLTFVVTGKHAARVCSLQRLRESWSLTSTDVDVYGRGVPQQVTEEDAAVSLTAHCWLPDGQLYLGNDAGELMVRLPHCRAMGGCVRHPTVHSGEQQGA